MGIQEDLEAIEADTLSPYATLAFRRLKNKAQVFLSPADLSITSKA